MTEEALWALAKEATKHAYAPYSGYAVGAAVLGADGEVFTGCNVECASYGGTCCAERVALYKGISEGHTAFTHIAVAASGAAVPVPCGICRQVLWELMPEGVVVVKDETGALRTYTVRELLPHGFSLDPNQ